MVFEYFEAEVVGKRNRMGTYLSADRRHSGKDFSLNRTETFRTNGEKHELQK